MQEYVQKVIEQDRASKAIDKCWKQALVSLQQDLARIMMCCHVSLIRSVGCILQELTMWTGDAAKKFLSNLDNKVLRKLYRDLTGHRQAPRVNHQELAACVVNLGKSCRDVLTRLDKPTLLAGMRSLYSSQGAFESSKAMQPEEEQSSHMLHIRCKIMLLCGESKVRQIVPGSNRVFQILSCCLAMGPVSFACDFTCCHFSIKLTCSARRCPVVPEELLSYT